MPAKQATGLKVPSDTTSSQLVRAVQTFYLDREAARCSAATLTWYRKYVGALLDWLTAHDVTQPQAITTELLRAYLVDLQGRDLAPRTIHHHASAARAFLRFLAAEGILTANPMQRVKMPKLPQTILDAFTAADVQAMLDACETERDRAIVLCLLDTGCRAAEFVALNVGDIDHKTGSVQVRSGKGEKGRVVFIGVRAQKAVLRYLLTRTPTADAPLWVSEHTGERLTHWGLRLALRRIGERASVTGVAPHRFRRTFALWSLRAGMNIYALQKLMGHADLSVLRRYLALAETDLQAAHKAHGAVDRLLK